MADIITPRPMHDSPTFGVNVKIAHPPGAEEGARRQARMQAFSMLDTVLDFDEPVTVWFSTPMIESAPGPDGKAVTTVTLNVIGKGIERKFKSKAERAAGPRQ